MKTCQLLLQLTSIRVLSGAELYWQHLPVDTNGVLLHTRLSRSDPTPSQLSLNLSIKSAVPLSRAPNAMALADAELPVARGLASVEGLKVVQFLSGDFDLSKHLSVYI